MSAMVLVLMGMGVRVGGGKCQSPPAFIVQVVDNDDAVNLRRSAYCMIMCTQLYSTVTC